MVRTLGRLLRTAGRPRGARGAMAVMVAAVVACSVPGASVQVATAAEPETTRDRTLLSLMLCGAPRHVVATVATTIDPVHHDFSRSVGALTAMKRRHDSQRGHTVVAEAVAADGSPISTRLAEGMYAGGLYAVRKMLPTRVEISAVEENGRGCAWVSDLQVEVRLSQPTIYVARRFADDPCRHRAILAHEETHHDIARTILHDVAEDLSRTVPRLLADIDVRAADVGRAQAALSDRIDAFTGAWMADLSARSEVAQARFDHEDNADAHCE